MRVADVFKWSFGSSGRLGATLLHMHASIWVLESCDGVFGSLEWFPSLSYRSLETGTLRYCSLGQAPEGPIPWAR
jgi:hypothetical protein